MGIRATVAVAVVAIFLAVGGFLGFRVHTLTQEVRAAQAEAQSAREALAAYQKVVRIDQGAMEARRVQMVKVEKEAVKQERKLNDALAKHEDVSSIMLPDDILSQLR